MQKVSKLIGNNIKKYKIEEKLKLYQACSIWEKIICEFFPEAAQMTMAICVEKGVLRVASLSREIADMIIMFQKRIIDEINARLGKTIVFRIYCEV